MPAGGQNPAAVETRRQPFDRITAHAALCFKALHRGPGTPGTQPEPDFGLTESFDPVRSQTVRTELKNNRWSGLRDFFQAEDATIETHLIVELLRPSWNAVSAGLQSKKERVMPALDVYRCRRFAQSRA